MEFAVQVAGAGNIACNQVLYHIRERSIEKDLIPFCQKNNIPVVAYSPFAQGNLPSVKTDQGHVLEQVGDQHKLTHKQVLLDFLLRFEQMFVIPKAAQSTHVAENAQAGRICLTKTNIQAIENAFPIHQKEYLPII
jgi:diketogulonate reductase-like aldo/keto reductase